MTPGSTGYGAADSARAGETGAPVDVSAIFGNARLSMLPVVVLVLSFVIIMADGFDLICLSFVAPQLAEIFGIQVFNFGPVFTSGFIGVMVGGVLIGPLADRYGRKIVLICSVTLFGVFSLMPLVDLSYSHLIVYRFITGLGLGGAMPGAAALTTEYAPARLRSLFANLMFAGVATGGVVGGFVASKLVPAYGWQVVFWMGGLTPLVLVPLLIVFMPESVAFLAVNKRKPEYVAKVLNRFVGQELYSASSSFAVQEAGRDEGGALRKLFTEGRAAGTLLIWLTSFAGLLTYGLLASWLPTFLTMGGMTVQASILGPVAMNLGGIAGTVLLGLVLIRLGLSPVISVSMVLTALSLLWMSSSIGGPANSYYSILATGLFLLGSVTSTNTLMAAFYPTKIRATGVGWALGIGRVGSSLGPTGGGLMLAYGFSPAAICQSIAVIILVGACAVAFVGVRYPAYRGAATRPSNLALAH